MTKRPGGYRMPKPIKKICKFCETEFFTVKADKEFCSCACKTNYKRSPDNDKTE